jgi:hypothetical protein
MSQIFTSITSIGTTKRGIGPAYSGKASRSGLRVHHLFNHTTFANKFRQIVEGRFKRYGQFEYDTEGEIERYKLFAERLRPYVIDSVVYMHKAISQGKRVLVEGANALMLDLDFGTYPYVTSSSTTIGGACTGLGIPPKMIGKTIGVVKAYTTRVGGGPFPTEQLNVSDYALTISNAFLILSRTGYWRPFTRGWKRVWYHHGKKTSLWMVRPSRPQILLLDQRLRRFKFNQTRHPRSITRNQSRSRIQIRWKRTRRFSRSVFTTISLRDIFPDWHNWQIPP